MDQLTCLTKIEAEQPQRLAMRSLNFIVVQRLEFQVMKRLLIEVAQPENLPRSSVGPYSIWVAYRAFRYLRSKIVS